MKISSKITLAVMAILILALLGLVISRQPALSDQDQIAAQIASARAAVQNHNVGGIMKIVSADFKTPYPMMSNVDQLNILLHRVIDKSGQSQVTLSPPDVVVQGDTATSTSQITVKDLDTSQSLLNQPLTLSWRREDGRRYLIFPIKVWRVVSVPYQGDLSEFD